MRSRFGRSRRNFRPPSSAAQHGQGIFPPSLRRSTFEVQQALADVSFSVERGEFFGIVGANGSGKSTLLKIIAQIYRQDSGTVEVEGLLSPSLSSVSASTLSSPRATISVSTPLCSVLHAESSTSASPRSWHFRSSNGSWIRNLRISLQECRFASPTRLRSKSTSTSCSSMRCWRSAMNTFRKSALVPSGTSELPGDGHFRQSRSRLSRPVLRPGALPSAAAGKKRSARPPR